MQSLTELYKAGRGPSSSHTMGPDRAARHFLATHPEADAFAVTLFGSLAKTGKGHGTDAEIQKTLSPLPCEVVFDYSDVDLNHPNTMDLMALQGDTELGRARVESVGGGTVRFQGAELAPSPLVYDLRKFTDISRYCKRELLRLWQFARRFEGEDFFDYMTEIWRTMKKSITS